MSVYLPDGATLALATTYGVAKATTIVTNASAAVVTAAAHGYANGDFVEVTSGWSRMDGRVFRIASITTDTFALEGYDTTDTTVFPAGSGLGSVKKVTAWTQITQVTKFDISGGEQQFATYSLLENDSESQIPTVTSPMSLSLAIADDPALPGFTALKVAGEARAIRALKMTLKGGSFILYSGYVSFNDTPKMSKGNIMECEGGLALRGKPVRYAS